MSSFGGKVCAEALVHSAIRDLCKSLLEEHGIRLERVDVNWEDVSALAESRMRITDISISTSTGEVFKGVRLL